MIPKTIHYCWFGKNPLPDFAKKCIESWKKNCSEYTIIQWNEDNFDIGSNQYVKEAYEQKKWAFVTDYVRLYVLYHFGGIYMDTDVEVLKPIDIFLEQEAFSGFESSIQVPTGIMASEKGHSFVGELLNDYKNRTFIKENGELDYTSNVITITKHCVEKGLILNNSKQIIKNFTFYPSEFFCPKDWKTQELNITENSYTIHHFDGSWLPKTEKMKIKLISKFGLKNIMKLKEFFRR